MSSLEKHLPTFGSKIRGLNSTGGETLSSCKCTNLHNHLNITGTLLEKVYIIHYSFQCGGTTHCLRLDWSPDGHYVVSAHAMNNSGPTAQIIERDGWKTSLDFVGHRKAITVVVRRA